MDLGRLRTRFAFLALPAFFLVFGSCEKPPATEILWDTYGVPHIYSSDAEGLLRAQGWAQMEAHGDLILRLFGEARGRGAEYWGADYLESDIRVRTLSIPELASAWSRDQEADMGRHLSAFVQGMNEYVETHPDRLAEEVRLVLPVVQEDVLAHLLRVIHFNFVSSPNAVPGSLQERLLEEALGEAVPGSNAWAIGPSRSAAGNAMLLVNPHLPWSGFFTWFENHLVGPDFDAYGATLVGMPLVTVGFTDHVAWTHTVNTHDGSDVYELTLEGDGYLYDGEVREFEAGVDTVRVRQEDGSLQLRPLVVRSSIHGPLVGMEEGKGYALRVVGLERPHTFGQYYAMLSARTLSEFENAMDDLQMPMFTTMYADADGHIMHLFGGLVPRRSQGDVGYWAGAVPGSTSETLWTEYHPYEDLPKAIDPSSGWLQNANDPPWTTTFPTPEGMDPEAYPPYMAPRFMHPRAQRSARLLMDDESISFDEMVEYKHSTRVELGERLVDELMAEARKTGRDGALIAADVLEAWDRTTDADSRGAVLFLAWAEAFAGQTRGNVFRIPWDPEDPLGTPRGLAQPELAVQLLERAADSVVARYGAPDIPFGDVYRLRRDTLDLPGNGMSGFAGVFRAASYARDQDGKYRIYGGDSYVLAVELADPIRARAVLGYGNASQPGSDHRIDQLRFFSEKRLRPVWRTREEIEANLSSRKTWR